MTCQNIQAAISETVYGPAQFPNFSEGVRAHLGECLGCRQHADELRTLSALVGSLPRVTAPTDFDFKLRARIARAKAEQREQVGWFAQIFNQSFSWAQAGTVMAAVALVVGLTTYQFMPHSTPQAAESTQVAATTRAPQVADARVEFGVVTPSSQRVESVRAEQVVQPRVRQAVAAPVHAASVKFNPAPTRPEVGTTNLVAARNTILIKGARSSAAQVVPLPSEVQEVTYGAQAVNFRPAAAAQTQNGEMAAAVIF